MFREGAAAVAETSSAAQGVLQAQPTLWGVIMNKFVSYLKDESGAAAAEYALILAVVGAAIAAAAFALGQAVSNAISVATSDINSGMSAG